MESVEFFIQQEGDRTWLPLESPEVEILEGRYRLVAKCDQPNTPVEVRVSYQPADAEQGEPKVWKREKNTNQEGLMVVLPFTYFQPGLWELTCDGDFVESLLENSWQHAVKLQALPKDRSDGPTSPASWEEGTISQTQEEAIESQEAIQTPDSSSSEVAADLDSEPTSSESSTEPEPSQQPNSDEDATEDAPNIAPTVADRSLVHSWHLILDRETYVLEQEATVTLSGRIEVTGVSAVELPDGVLQVRLYDPQTSQVLLDQQYPTPETIPSSFGYSLEISGERKRLMLGEARLYDAYGKQLAMGTFSIMAQLQAWLDSLHQETAEDNPPSPSPSPSESQSWEKADINLSFLDLVNNKDKDTSQQTSNTPAKDETRQTTKTNSVLPPQLQPTDSKSSESQPSPPPRPSKSPELPSFGKSLYPESPTPSPEANTPEPTSEAPAEPESPPEVQPEANQASETPPATHTSENPSQLEEADSGSQEPEVTLSSEAAAFPALQNRLWSRLNAMARDGELAEWLKWHLPPLAEESPHETQEAIAETTEDTGTVEKTEIEEDSPTTDETSASKPTSDRATNEIVVMDEEEGTGPNSHSYSSHFLSMPESFSHPANRGESSLAATDQNQEPSLAERSFTPQFSLPEEDFIAGRTSWVTVKIPILDARVYVKLWLQDCESRTLLDGPYWLTEFTPDGWGYELASTEVTIPYGSLQVQLEAIAVDVHTRQESYKASVRRLVVPPGPPTLPQT
jgi:hypothetical protein